MAGRQLASAAARDVELDDLESLESSEASQPVGLGRLKALLPVKGNTQQQQSTPQQQQQQQQQTQLRGAEGLATTDASAIIEVAAAVEERIDPALLAEVKRYEALPSDAASYGRTHFWDGRYMELGDLVFEWYHPWQNIAPSLTQYMEPADNVLVCGCGNSELSVDMYTAGFTNITNVDNSRVVIDMMQDKYPNADYPGMTWRALDLTLTDYDSCSYDVAVDKACLDAVACRLDGQKRAAKYLLEIDRLLKNEGVYICVSHGRPEDRLNLLEKWDLDKAPECLCWDVHVDAVAKPTVKAHEYPDLNDPDQVYFIYVCIKNPEKVRLKDVVLAKAQKEQEKKLMKLMGKTGLRPR